MRSAAVLCVIASLGVASPAAAADPDPWLGEDKALHFSASAAAAGLAYGASSLIVRPRWQRATIGATGALVLGIGKELYDATGRGDPSFKDLAWDSVGTAVGVALAFGVDLLFGRATSATADSGGVVALSF